MVKKYYELAVDVIQFQVYGHERTIIFGAENDFKN